MPTHRSSKEEVATDFDSRSREAKRAIAPHSRQLSQRSQALQRTNNRRGQHGESIYVFETGRTPLDFRMYSPGFEPGALDQVCTDEPIAFAITVNASAFNPRAHRQFLKEVLRQPQMVMTMREKCVADSQHTTIRSLTPCQAFDKTCMYELEQSVKHRVHSTFLT